VPACQTGKPGFKVFRDGHHRHFAALRRDARAALTARSTGLAVIGTANG
jgi:hypothetical protein